MPAEDIKDRLLFRQVIEAVKCLEEGVLRSVADGNVGSILGIGAPMWTGGFLQFVNGHRDSCRYRNYSPHRKASCDARNALLCG